MSTHDMTLPQTQHKTPSPSFDCMTKLCSGAQAPAHFNSIQTAPHRKSGAWKGTGVSRARCSRCRQHPQPSGG